MSDNQQNENQGSFWNSIPGLLTALATLITALAGLHVFLPDDPVQSSQEKECTIKGNISHNSGKRIYHMPGDKDYKNTNIDTSRGERFFCTAAEAEENGYRRAPR